MSAAFEADPLRSPKDYIEVYIDNVAAADRNVTFESTVHPDFSTREQLPGLMSGVSFLLGREVVGSGQVMQRFDHETAQAHGTGLMLPEGMPRIRVRGIYRGIRIVSAFHGETDRVHSRVVHSFEVSSETRRNIYHDPRPIPEYENLCGEGALLFPAEPVYAHSSQEMKEDIFAQTYDDIMSAPESEEFGEVEKVKAVAELVDELLIRHGHAPNRRNHRRVSWLNSQELIQGRTIKAVNYVAGSPKIGERIRGQNFSDMSESAEIIAGDFTVFEGYTRVAGENRAIAYEGHKILYLRGKIGDQDVLVPVRNITDII